ncbi:MAG: sodium:calcium antiporter [Rhodospirillales bacterium]|nr:sodium:calcium antiporter [Alphaproteobacteria bacterium]MBL6947225.1 sodium:calcium antiporter [Rhodospirillales bacterium]
MDLFPQLPLAFNIVAFSVFASAIWIAGTRLSYLAVAIGEFTGVGHAIMGLVFLGGITELPELVTTGAAALKGNAALALNNMLGGIPMQTAILAVADMVALRVALTSSTHRLTPILEAVLLALLLMALFALVSVGEVTLFAGLGLGATVLAGLYLLSIYVLNRYDQAHAWQPADSVEATEDVPQVRLDSLRALSTRALAMQSCGAAAVILVCGVLLVEVCETIALQSSLGNSFIGVTLLAATTSLPELSTTIAAVRMGAYTMAISNIFGSNLLMVFILLPADLLYREGEILARADDTSRMALLSGIAVTLVYIVGLLIRKRPRVFGMGIDSAVVMAIYLTSLCGFYIVR